MPMQDEVRIKVRTNDAHSTRFVVCEKVRDLTGRRFRWKEGESFHFQVRKHHVQTLMDAGLNVEVVE